MRFYNAKVIDFIEKKVIICDLDGTLTASKSKVTTEMLEVMRKLLKFYIIAIVSGGTFSQFEKQIINFIPHDRRYLSRFFMFPTNGSRLLRFVKDDWIEIYSIILSEDERKSIINAFEVVIKEFEFAKPSKIFGRQIEDRGSQVTYSAIGQFAPLSLKKKWDPDTSKRKLMKTRMEELLPNFEIRIGGTTSLDVTKHGINKSYSVIKMKELTGYDIGNMLFVGDSLFKGGNDYVVRSTRIECVQVDDFKETISLFNKVCELNTS